CRVFQGELDWVVMKCLEKDRNRRYETANGLARELERYLHNEPVQACPPSMLYRLRKLAGRNRAALAVLTSLALLVTVTAVGTSVAALMLRAAQKATQDQLDLTQKAEQEGRRRLYRSLVDQARASRMSRRAGQRLGSLHALEEAATLA